MTEGQRIREILRICCYEENFHLIEDLLLNMDMTESTAVLTAPLCTTWLYPHKAPGRAEYERRVLTELRSRNEPELEELLKEKWWLTL